MRQFAEESEIANNCLKLSVCLSGGSGVLSRNKGDLSLHHGENARETVGQITAQRETMIFRFVRPLDLAHGFAFSFIT